MNCFEGNTFSGGISGLGGLEHARSLVLAGNTFTVSGTVTGITFPANHVPVLRENQWINFTTPYGGTTPGAVLALPVRAVELSDSLTNAVLDVWNTGTSNLSWTASTTNSWITVTQGSGTVASENAWGLLAFHIDPSAIPAGVSNGTVAVVGGGQTNQVDVGYSD